MANFKKKTQVVQAVSDGISGIRYAWELLGQAEDFFNEKAAKVVELNQDQECKDFFDNDQDIQDKKTVALSAKADITTFKNSFYSTYQEEIDNYEPEG